MERLHAGLDAVHPDHLGDVGGEHVDGVGVLPGHVAFINGETGAAVLGIAAADDQAGDLAAEAVLEDRADGALDELALRGIVESAGGVDARGPGQSGDEWAGNVGQVDGRVGVADHELIQQRRRNGCRGAEDHVQARTVELVFDGREAVDDRTPLRGLHLRVPRVVDVAEAGLNLVVDMAVDAEQLFAPVGRRRKRVIETIPRGGIGALRDNIGAAAGG